MRTATDALLERAAAVRDGITDLRDRGRGWRGLAKDLAQWLKEHPA